MPDSRLALVPLLVALALFFFSAWHFDRRAERARRRGLAARVAELTGRGAPVHESGGMASVVARIGELALKGKEGRNELRLQLVRAGFRGPAAVRLFQGARLLLAAALPALALVLSQFLPAGLIAEEPRSSFMGLGLFGSGLALLGSRWWLRRRVAARRKAMAESLPEALDLLVVCVDAGLGLDAAVQRVTRELDRSHAILVGEFQIMSLELRAGRTRRDALRDLAQRVGLEELSSLVAVLVQAESLGTSISQALRVFSAEMRDKRFQRAEEAAAKLPVKMSVPLILFIFPALFVALLGPPIITALQTFSF